VLRDLEEADGPGEGTRGEERWDRWYALCTRRGVRLEDCTGELLGTLPMDPDDDDEEEDEEEEEEEDSEEYDSDGPPPEGSLGDLRLLLEECRKMSETREEAGPFSSFPSGFGRGRGQMMPFVGGTR
jgi:hypothetical protein